jgi:hypothetical protein
MTQTGMSSRARWTTTSYRSHTQADGVNSGSSHQRGKGSYDIGKARTVTENEFAQRVGRLPIQDDMERTNCPDAGSTGHSMCGVCVEHDMPRFSGGHYHNCHLKTGE